jgi:hypothetical protein
LSLGPYAQEKAAAESNDLDRYTAAKTDADRFAGIANGFYVGAAVAAVAAIIILIVSWPAAGTAPALPGSGGST